VKFGLLMENSVPRPWTRFAERDVFRNSIEQVQVAESAGFERVWAVEHHFLEEYSHSSCPEMFLTACAMVTSKIRLGFGIATCVPEMNHPARIAERAATLDLLSNGRVDVGTGRSSTWNELGGFRANIDNTKKSWDEYIHAIPRMWTQERFAHEGSSFSMPERCVLPKPLQKPHPPLWVAVTSPGTEIDAAERGLGCLTLAFGNVGGFVDRFAAYRKRIKTCEPAGAFVNEQVAAASWLFCHPDADMAIEKGRRMLTGFGSASSQIMEIKQAYPASNYLEPGLLGMFRADPDSPGMKGKKIPDGLCVGDPAMIIEALKRWENAGADSVVFLINYMEVLTQSEVLDSLRLFAKEVMPHFDKSKTDVKVAEEQYRVRS
jgi:alkanesulfonate monooxygenase SsuD/methylene tetrahydromethanopterin reductase-like flavin-dependent oxidoreductase (luciferase family)